jgi:hypothetical protein
MRIEHQLAPVQKKHTGEVLQQIANADLMALAARGRAAQAVAEAEHMEREAGFMRRHLGELIRLTAATEHLPESRTPWALSEDGTKLIGELEEKPKEAPDGVASNG